MLALYVTFARENFVKGPANLFTQALADLRLDGLLALIAMTYGRLGDLFLLLRNPEQLQGTSREFSAQLETASYQKMKDWRMLLIQYLLQQNRSVTGKDKVATATSECRQYCGMPLLTDLAVMMRIDPLALVFGLREFVTVVYGPVMSHAFPDVQVKACKNSVLHVNLVPVVDSSLLNWVEQKELRGLASDDRLFGRKAESEWMLMHFNNNFKCRMGGEDIFHVQFNPKLRSMRPVVKDSGEAMRVSAWPEAYAHVKESQQVWLAGSIPLPDQCPRYPPIRRMLLGVTSPAIPLLSERLVTRKKNYGNGVKGWSRASSAGTLRPCINLISLFLMHGAGRRTSHHLPKNPGFPMMCGTTCTHQPMIGHV